MNINNDTNLLTNSSQIASQNQEVVILNSRKVQTKKSLHKWTAKDDKKLFSRVSKVIEDNEVRWDEIELIKGMTKPQMQGRFYRWKCKTENSKLIKFLTARNGIKVNIQDTSIDFERDEIKRKNFKVTIIDSRKETNGFPKYGQNQSLNSSLAEKNIKKAKKVLWTNPDLENLFSAVRRNIKNDKTKRWKSIRIGNRTWISLKRKFYEYRSWVLNQVNKPLFTSHAPIQIDLVKQIISKLPSGDPYQVKIIRNDQINRNLTDCDTDTEIDTDTDIDIDSEILSSEDKPKTIYIK